MVSWWGRDSYINNEKLSISDAELINYTYGSS